MYLRARQLYADKKYGEAGDEFAAAYAIDPDSKFLLFNVALSRRMQGECREALTAYRTFLAANPPTAYVTNAQTGIDRCEATLQQADEGKTKADKPDDKPPQQAVEHPPVAPARPVEAPRHAPWYSDGIGDVMVATGSAAIVASVLLQVSARSAARTTFHPVSLADYESNRDSATTGETISWIVGGAGLVLITAGVLHIRKHQRAFAFTPSSKGVAITFGGAF
jgi:hypothetical protein